MNRLDKLDKSKIHSRSISAETYVVDANHLVVEGILRDDRTKESCRSTGERMPAGTIHHMVIRLLLSLPSLLIEEVEVEVLSAPYSECLETCEVLKGMKGVSISAGFSKKVRSLSGGPRGCAHLVSLLLVMGQAAFQGHWTHKSTDAHPDDIYSEERRQTLEGTCWAWRKDGELQKKLQKKS